MGRRMACALVLCAVLAWSQGTHIGGGQAASPNAAPPAFLINDYTNATTGMTSVTGMSLTVAANTNYELACHLYYQGSATTAGLLVQVTGPAAPTAVKIGYRQPLTASTYNDAVITALATPVGASSPISATTNFEAVLTIGFKNGANAGTLQIQAAAAGVGTVTIGSASWCI